MTASPRIAAVMKVASSVGACREPNAAKAPAANSRESPGRNGVRTRPVSAKTMANRIPYVLRPCCAMMALRCLSKCSAKSRIPSTGYTGRYTC